VLITLPVPLFLKYLFPVLPFFDNMLASFLIISTQMIIVNLFDKRSVLNRQNWELPEGIFRIDEPVFKWFATGIPVIICLLNIFSRKKINYEELILFSYPGHPDCHRIMPVRKRLFCKICSQSNYQPKWNMEGA
jgi:hypothetical protein